MMGKFWLAWSARPGYSHALGNITEMLRSTAQMANLQITGIGIGSTGPVYSLTGEIGNFFPHWRGENPVRDLSQIFAVKVAMDNDAECGSSWRIRLGCGFRGCWESLAAGPSMVAWLDSQARAGDAPRGKLTAKRICELAVGDELAIRVVERETYYYYLGLGLANLVTLFTPDVIVLGGGVMKSANLFLDGIHRIIRESCGFVPSERTELTRASLGEDANLIGAARVWHNRFAGRGAQRAC